MQLHFSGRCSHFDHLITSSCVCTQLITSAADFPGHPYRSPSTAVPFYLYGGPPLYISCFQAAPADFPDRQFPPLPLSASRFSNLIVLPSFFPWYLFRKITNFTSDLPRQSPPECKLVHRNYSETESPKARSQSPHLWTVLHLYLSSIE